MNLVTDRRERIRFLKFSFVGITGAIVDFGIMNLLRLVVDVPLVWAQAVSFICAVINNFLWNRYWTYPDSRSKGVSSQLTQFFLINTIGILIRTPLVPWLDRVFSNILDKLSIEMPLSNNVISQNLALAFGIFVILLWNYFANRHWTYNDIPVNDELMVKFNPDSSDENLP